MSILKANLSRALAILVALFLILGSFGIAVSAEGGNVYNDVSLSFDPGIAYNNSSFYMSVSNRDITSGWFAYQPKDENSGVFVNGTKLQGTGIIIGWAGSGYTSFPAVNEFDVITIKGTFTCNDANSTDTFSVNEMNVMYTGTAWTSSVPNITGVKLSPSGIAPFSNGFYASISDRAGAVSGSYGYKAITDSSGIYYNGTKLNKVFVMAWAGDITVYITDSPASPQAGDVVKITGVFAYQGSDNNYVMKIDEYTTSFDGTKWSVAPSVTDVALSEIDIPVSSSAFYFNVGDKNIPVSDWNDGTTFYKPSGENSGVFLNGNKVDANIVMAWAGGGYTSLGSNVLNFGDKVIIKGTFLSSHYGFTVAEKAFYYKGDSLMTNTAITLGDPNIDGTVDIRDLTRFKKLFAAGTQSSYAAALDMNSDGTVDTKDLTIIRKVLLGLYTIIDGEVTLPVYKSDKSVELFADFSPNPFYKTKISDYFGAGFTSMVLTEDIVDFTNSNGNITNSYMNAIANIKEYGDVIVRNHYDFEHYFQNPNGLGTTDYYGKPVEIPVRNITNELYNLGVHGIYANDEPKYDEIDGIVTLANWHNLYNPGKLFHVNLFPSYGNAYFSGHTFAEYVQKYADTVLSRVTTPKTLSIDNYPLITKNGTNVIRDSYLSDLVTVANIARDFNLQHSDSKTDVSFAIQAFSENDIRAIGSRADISFQTNVGLALGAHSFEYFLYETAGNMNGIINSDGTKKVSYDFVKSVNDELKSWDDVFLSFEWKGMKTYSGTANSGYNFTNIATAQLTAFDKISSVTASADTIVGEFCDKDSNYGYMAVNFSEPSSIVTDTVTLNIPNASHAVVYINGTPKSHTLNNGTLELSLDAGSAAFIIPC